MPLSQEDIQAILQIIDEAPLAELRVETDGFSLHVVKGGAAGPEPISRSEEPAAAPAPDRPAQPPPTRVPPPATGSADLITIEAPMLGVFYRAEGPGQRPFVEPGSHVDPDTTLCIIEVMKMMNSIPAGLAGTIVEVCQENAAIVEEGAPLFRVRPD